MKRLAFVLLLAGCDDPPPAAEVSEPQPGVEVPGLAAIEDRNAPAKKAPNLSPGNGFQIADAPPLHGDPAACAAFEACCRGVDGQVSPAGLACGLAPAVGNGDCTRALESVRAIFREQAIPGPPGCM